MTALLALLFALSLAGCRSSEPTVTLYTSVDQVFSEPILRKFERQSGIAVRAVFDTEETKSTGVVNRLIAEAGSPQADVFWSGDPVRPFLLLRRGLIERYPSPSAAGIPAAFKAADGSWAGTAARARVLLVNKDRVSPEQTPRSIRDLVDPRWKGDVAIANPLFGTTTMHVAALFAVWGEEETMAFLAALRANDVRIASSNGEVKRLVATGEVSFGLTDTDDAHEAMQDGAPVAVVYPDQDGIGTLLIPTTVVLLKGAPHPDNGRKLVDYLLSPAVEEQMAASAAHMPLREGVQAAARVPRVKDIRAMAIEYPRLAAEMEAIQPRIRAWVGF